MYPNICHIYGPLYLNCYGLSIALGVIAFISLIKKDKKFSNLITAEKFNNIMFFSILIGIFGARILWAFEEWNTIKLFDFFRLWEPGYSFLGTLIGIIIFVPFYLKKTNVQILPFLDLVSIYAPLLHSISRIGCFLAGCCHGIPTNAAWGIIYTHKDVVVPTYLKFIKIHPTQLYTAFFLFGLFILMYYFFQYRFRLPGQLLSIYLIFTSTDRFLNDFFRADRDFVNAPIINLFSYHQWLSLFIFILGILLFLHVTYKTLIYNKNVLYKS